MRLKENLMQIKFTILALLLYGQVAMAQTTVDTIQFFKADNSNIQYTGRFDFSRPALPRIWSPGGYFRVRFAGSSCEIIINDEELYGKNHNYLEIVIDHHQPFRIQTTGKTNSIKVAEGLQGGEHELLVCKNTESNIGYIELVGIKCKQLLPPAAKPVRKIEFIGNSITCGTGSDVSVVPCGKGEWHDQHNAYMSYGPSTARVLNAQWQLTSVSGIGLIHSCCNLKVLMPQVFDKVNLRDDSIMWNFSNYQPNVVTICLGQNDGVQDSVKYCSAYVDFIKTIRSHYPAATVVCLTSPMADSALVKVMKNYLTGIVSYVNKSGDGNVYKYFFSKRYFHGCDSHPDMEEHQLIANELIACIRKIKNW